MAVAFVKAHTLDSNKTSGTTVAPTVTGVASPIPAGNLVVYAIEFDNAATASKPIVSSISRPAGETASWVFLGAARSTSTTAGSFASGELWAIKTTTAWAGGTAITATLDTAVTQKAANMFEFSGADATMRSTTGTAYSTTTTAASAATTGTTPLTGDLILGFLFGSNVAAAQAGDTDTLAGSWSTPSGLGTTGGNVATNNFGIFQYKIMAGSAVQTYNNSAAMTAGNGSIVAALISTPQPAITQAAYRWFAEGTEAGATALAAQDTPVTGNISNGDATGTLRIRLQETSGVAVFPTDDFQLQYKRGGEEYDVSNATVGTSATLNSTNPQVAQSFIASGGPLTNATFNLSKSNTPTGTVTAALWAHDGGTFGGTGLPTGSPLATSTTSVTASALTTTPVMTTFNFDGTFRMVTSTPYFIGLIATGGAATPNSVNVSADSSAPTHAGVRAFFTTSWATGPNDLIFEVNTWTNVTGPTLAAGYDASNYSGTVGIDATTPNAQSFQGDGKRLARAGAYLIKSGTPSGTVTMSLWAHSGTFGSTGIPTGSPLATSTTVIDSTSLSGTPTMVYFDFDGTVTLANGTNYFIGVTTTGGASAVLWGVDGTSPTHVGNRAFQASGTWFSTTAGDFIFEVWTQPASASTVLTYDSPNLTNGQATTNRLTGGTGTFVAGKVSEDALMDDLGWAGSNYTELVYALKIKAADLADGDALRFRVLRNNTSTEMTYAQTPVINLIKPAVAVTQAAFRFYADGTESGSTALAAQSTAPTVDLTSGDANVGLRALLQSTSLANVPTTDDWQIQWEKNASGTWTNLGGTTALPYDSPNLHDSGEIWPVDLYNPANRDNTQFLDTATKEYGQSFLGNGDAIVAASFYLQKAGTPNGTLSAAIYAHTGTFGTTGLPTGAPLAVSTTTVDPTTLTTSYAVVEFDFDGSFVAVSGTPYVAVVRNTAITTSAPTNAVQVGIDLSSPTAAGNGAALSTASGLWATTGGDLIFEVDGSGATTNRLTGGTGTFTNGKISEAGLVTDLGWGPSNYTEVLYSVTLKQADLANADTLRFRVLRNGATTSLTYTATPTVNVTIGAGLTAVQVDRPTTWDTTQAVGPTRSTTWDVTTPVTLTRATSWDVTIPITIIRGSSTWKVQQAVGPIRNTTWDTTFAITRTRNTTWDVLTPVPLTRSTTWDVTTAPTITRSTTWDTLLTITPTKTTTWDSTRPITVTRQTTWDSTFAVTKALSQTTWKTRQAVTPTKSTTWDTTFAVTKTTSATTWQAKQTIVATRTTSWNILSAAAPPGSWVNVPLTGPLAVTSGTGYVVSVTTDGYDYGYQPTEPSSLSPNMTGPDAVYAAGTNVFPSIDAGANHYPLDVLYHVGPISAPSPTSWKTRQAITLVRDTSWNVAGAKTQIGVDRTTTWKTQQAITLVRAATWDANVRVTLTRPTTWDVTTPVTLTRATTWDVTTPATLTRPTTWDVLVPITKTPGATTWKVRQAVTITRPTTWRAAQAVTVTRNTTWDVLTPTTLTRSTTWDALSVRIITRPTTWDATFAITTPRTTTWDSLLVINRTPGQTTWNIRSAVTVTRPTTWRVQQAVTITRPTTWRAAAAITLTRPTTWDVTTPAVRTRATTWDVTTAITVVRSTTWDATTPIVAVRSTTWDVTTPVSLTRATTWDTTVAVTLVRSTTWDTTQAVTITRPTTWDVLSSRTITRGSTTWNIRALATNTRSTTWDVFGFRATIIIVRPTTWNVVGQPTLTRNTTWDVTTPVTITRSTTWRTTQAVTRVRSTTWNTTARVTLTRSTTWDVLTPVTLTRSTTWDATTAISLVRSTTWDATVKITQTRPTTWDVLTPITLTRSTTWDSTVAIAITRSSTWDANRAITTTRATTWDTTLAVAITRSTTWRASFALVVTRSATWDTMVAVTVTRSTTWRAAFALVATRSTTWDVLTPVAATIRSTTWDVLFSVAATTRFTTWDALRAVTVITRSTTWDVLAPVSQLRSTTWNVRSAVSITRSTTWNSLRAVSRACSTTWNIRAATALTRSTTWDVLTPTSRTLSTTWNIAGAPGVTRSTTWRADAVLSQTRATTWDVLTPVVVTRATTWDVTTPVTLTRSTTWDSTFVVSITRPTTWDALIPVTRTRSTTWNLRAAPTLTRSTSWNVAGVLFQITVIRSTTWKTRQAVGPTRATTWDTLAVTSLTRNTTWNATSLVALTRPTTWQAKKVTQTTRNTTWDVTTPVVLTRSSLWRVRQAVETTRSTTWDVTKPVAVTRSTTWQIRPLVTLTRSTTWDITMSVTRTRSTTWRVRESVVSFRPTTWDVLVAISATRNTRWDVLAAVSRTRSTTWKLRGQIVTFRTVSWDTRTRTTLVQATTWDVTIKVTRTRTTTWDTLRMVVRVRQASWDVLYGFLTAPYGQVVDWRSAAPLMIWKDGVLYPVEIFMSVPESPEVQEQGAWARW